MNNVMNTAGGAQNYSLIHILIGIATFLITVVAAILIPGIGGLILNFGPISISSIAPALILGIITNLLLKDKKPAENNDQ